MILSTHSSLCTSESDGVRNVHRSLGFGFPLVTAPFYANDFTACTLAFRKPIGLKPYDLYNIKQTSCKLEQVSTTTVITLQPIPADFIIHMSLSFIQLQARAPRPIRYVLGCEYVISC